MLALLAVSGDSALAQVCSSFPWLLRPTVPFGVVKECRLSGFRRQGQDVDGAVLLLRLRGPAAYLPQLLGVSGMAGLALRSPSPLLSQRLWLRPFETTKVS